MISNTAMETCPHLKVSTSPPMTGLLCAAGAAGRDLERVLSPHCCWALSPALRHQAREKAAAAVGFGRRNETMRNGLLGSLSSAAATGRTFLLSQDLGYCAA